MSLNNSDDSSIQSVNSNDYQSSSRSSCSGTVHTHSTEEEMDTIKNQLTNRESAAVFRLRVMVILVLVAVAVSLSFTVYELTRDEEIASFEGHFEGSAEVRDTPD
jgi:hypothetical protein